MGLSTPILFLIFNRPEKSEKVFSTIRQQQPDRLFIAADGARPDKEGEAELCKQTRQTIQSKIDWPCEVNLLFRDNNLGCKVAVSSAIDWFFSKVEKGIILEDDCLPDPSFFAFCEEMLERYTDDSRVMHITGSNFVSNKISFQKSYYFSRFPNIWGWATWRRAWKKYDVNIPEYPVFEKKGLFRKMFSDRIMAAYFEGFFQIVYSQQFNTWDIQWVFTVLKNNGLCIVPSQNLISNIGYGSDATHTVNGNPELENVPSGSISKITHPDHIFADTEADTLYFDRVHEGAKFRFRETLPGKIDTFKSKVIFKIKQIAGIKNY